MQSIRNGAAPYLSLEDRLAFGVTRSGTGSPHAAHGVGRGGGLKFQAYERAAPPPPKPIAVADPFAGEQLACAALEGAVGMLAALEQNYGRLGPICLPMALWTEFGPTACLQPRAR